MGSRLIASGLTSLIFDTPSLVQYFQYASLYPFKFKGWKARSSRDGKGFGIRRPFKNKVCQGWPIHEANKSINIRKQFGGDVDNW